MNEPMIRPLNEQRGVVLIVSLLVMVILSVLGLAFLTTARTEDTIASNYRNQTTAFYAAEAGLESGIASLKTLLGANPTPTDPQLAALAPRPLTNPSYTFNAFQVRRVRTVQPYAYQTTITSGTYQGLFALTTDYVIAATVTGPRGSRARVGQTFQHLGIPLFQFGVLYGRGVDLEISPAPVMTFAGRVHANSNIYMIAKAGLQFDSSITTTGNIYRYLKNEPPTNHYNDPLIKDASGNYQQLNFDHVTDVGFANPWSAAQWKNAALSTFGGRVQDSAMGVQEIRPPISDVLYNPNQADVSSHLMIEKGTVVDSPDLQAAKLYYKADLRIENGSATDKNGNSVNLAPCGAIFTKTFYDKREQKTMSVTEVDVGKLTACGKMPANGVLYVYKDDGVSDKGAVRLVNGSQLPSQGLTVISENPVYIQGDYNTVNKVPAAVLGDAITVLSTNWKPNNSDTKGSQDNTTRPAANTTVNAALALGPSSESTMGQSNGHFENLIRLLEDWNGKTINYNGSLVALWHSERATGQWSCCSSSGPYSPPIRNWAYDSLFNTQQPPGTPMGIITARSQWSEG